MKPCFGKSTVGLRSYGAAMDTAYARNPRLTYAVLEVKRVQRNAFLRFVFFAEGNRLNGREQ